MLPTAQWYFFPYINDLLKDLKAVAEPPLIIPILVLTPLKQIDAAQLVSVILLFFIPVN